MPTYQQCSVTNDGDEVLKIAKLLIAAFEPLRPLEKVKVDFVWAFADLNDKGEQCNDAITLRGHRAYGLCRIVNLKDRAKGNGDAEIVIDHDYWQEIPEAQQRALVDHELNHIQICVNKKGDPKFDDLNRPKLALRKHDIEVGWFSSVAQRHGAHSLEQIQAKQILDSDGQYLWPQLVQGGTQVSSPKRLAGVDEDKSTVTISAEGMKPVTMTTAEFSRATKILSNKKA
jgi:hypothetical protein